MRFSPLFILLFLALAAYGQEPQTSVAVLPSDRTDNTVLNNDELEVLTDKMRQAALEVLPTETFVLLKQDVVIKRLGGAENYIKECTESSCIVNLGKKAQVDYVSQASVGKLGNKIRLKVELYNVRTGGLVGMLSYEKSEKFEDLLDIIEERAPALFKKILPKEQPPVIVATPPPQQYAPPEKPVVSEANAYRQVFLFDKIQKLIKDDFKKNKEEIQMESASLSNANRESLYEKNRKTTASSFGYAALNTFFGLGSYMQGNIKWGVVQSVLVVGGGGVAIARNEDVAIGIAMIGWITGLIAPFFYQRGYNKNLREALGYNSVSYSIDPLIVPRNGMPALGLAFNGRF